MAENIFKHIFLAESIYVFVPADKVGQSMVSIHTYVHMSVHLNDGLWALTEKF